MDVLGASEKLAICAWIDADGQHEEIFSTDSLRKVVQQMQQQPQEPAPPGTLPG